MPIFNGTDIQRIIEEDARFLSPAKIKDCFQRLVGKETRHVLGAEWELVVFNQMSRAGQIAEVSTSKASGEPSSQPDCLFRPDPSIFADPLAAGLPETLLIEVTTVSDLDSGQNNPRQEFHEAFRRLLKRHKLPVQRFRLDLKGEIKKKQKAISDAPPKEFNVAAWLRPDFNHGKMMLALPPRGMIASFVKTHLKGWVEAVANAPDEVRNLDFDQEGVRFTLNYDPNKPDHGIFSPGGYPSYTETYSIDDNPVARRLKTKAEQVSESAHRDLTAGIILCDGGCDLLADRGGYGGPMSFDLKGVLGNCFKRPNFHRISFVVTLSPFTPVNGWGMTSEPQTQVQAFGNPNADHRLSNEVLDDLVRRALCDRLPGPVNTASNAGHLIAKRGGFPKGNPPDGGFRLPML